MSEETKKTLSRREFLAVGSTGLLGISLGVVGTYATAKNLAGGTAFAIPASEGYLVVDYKKCGGCLSCMLGCSMAHEGKANLSLSRIQIVQNPFAGFPNDIAQAQCRQCVFPPCVEACPTGALHAEKKYGNVRLIDYEKCIGCQRCVEACPRVPSRAIWNHVDKHSIKCDLCANTPYWSEGGGPTGKQVCMEICPTKGIKFVKDIPTQAGDGGYVVNLRNEHWGKLGLPID
ncbi:MAG: 4Fe-4S dicluster domain-containing protein [Candidatus Aquicultorales bacterium]